MNDDLIIKPRIRGFICTTAHPVGCSVNVAEQIATVRAAGKIENGPQNVLVLGCSGGFGLAARIASAFGAGASTLGISFEREPTETRTASAGWYNNLAFDRQAEANGLSSISRDLDAFSDETKRQVAELARDNMGPIDLVVYSLATPVRPHPRTGVLHRSAIKPIGETVQVKTLNLDSGAVHNVDLEPASAKEIDDTVAVMGGEDWQFWMESLLEAGVLNEGCQSIAFDYVGSELTWPIYRLATLGRAKEDLERRSRNISAMLAGIGGSARIAVLKFVVTQASAAIPVVPLYGSLLLRVMRERGGDERPIEHIDRLFRTQLYSDAELRLDDIGRIRMDNLELASDIQDEVRRRWDLVNTENLAELSDFDRFKTEFLRIFGFGLADVDYEVDVDPGG